MSEYQSLTSHVFHHSIRCILKYTNSPKYIVFKHFHSGLHFDPCSKTKDTRLGKLASKQKGNNTRQSLRCVQRAKLALHRASARYDAHAHPNAIRAPQFGRVRVRLQIDFAVWQVPMPPHWLCRLNQCQIKECATPVLNSQLGTAN